MQHRRVGVLERLPAKPPGKPIQVWPVLDDEPADRHERSGVGLHVVREIHEKQVLDEVEVDGEEGDDVDRGANSQAGQQLLSITRRW